MKDDREDIDLFEDDEKKVAAKKRNFLRFGMNHTEPDEEETEETGFDFSGIRNILIGILVVVIICIIIVKLNPSANYNSYEVVEETSVTNASMVDYVPYQNSLLKFSRDGATYVDEKGESVWTETFAMKMPAADVCGDYVAIADLNGNDVYIFDKEGKVSNTTMPYSICDIAVASQGEFAVILEGKNENYINLYDRKGSQIMERKTAIDQNGYPLDVDLSVNGEKMFSSYLAINESGELESKLTASNFGEVGQNENADRIVGAYQLENTIVPKVEFLNDNTICAFGDNQFLIFSMKEKSSKKAVIEFEGEIQSVVYNSQYVGVVMYNEDEKSEAPYVLKLYNLNGHETLKKEIDFDYKNVRMSEEEIIFTGGNEARIFTMNGKLKFSYSFSKSVKNIVPTGYSKRYVVIYDSGSEVIRLKHKSEKEKV
ncbi:MAG: DUF5711 family protein [Lachnospiraceae bacterium]